jgi:hypothetical protein
MPRQVRLHADQPNVVLPLATSYNERGVAGYTHTVTNSEDQRKINCCYELVKNPITGKGTLSLVKRPGVTINASTYTASASYLIADAGSASLEATPLVYSKNGTNIVISSASATNNIYSIHRDRDIY